MRPVLTQFWVAIDQVAHLDVHMSDIWSHSEVRDLHVGLLGLVEHAVTLDLPGTADVGHVHLRGK